METGDTLHDPPVRGSVVAAIRSYLRAVSDDFRREFRPADTRLEGPQTTTDAVFALLAHREFPYLSNARSRSYRDAIVAQLIRDVTAERPLRFYYDIGGGYRA